MVQNKLDIAMPKIMSTVQDIDKTFTRPIVFGIVRQLLKNIGLPDDLKIFYPDGTEKDAQLDSTLEKDGDKVKFSAHERFSIEVEEDFDAGRILTSATHQREHFPFFLDESLSIQLKPVFATSAFTINVRYKASDKSKAERWRNDIKSRASMLRDVFLHDAQYHYLVPDHMVIVLYKLHELREKVAPYNEDFNEYLKKYSTTKVGMVTNLNAAQRALAVSDTQTNVQGYFDFDAVPEKGSKEGEASNWTISFSYKFTIEKPISIAMTYPIMVHNQPLDYNYIDDEVSNKDSAKIPTRRSVSFDALSNFEIAKREMPGIGTSGIAIPQADDFMPNVIIPNTIRIMTAMTSISETDKRTLLSLKELGDYVIDNDVIDFLVGEGNKLLQPNRSAFNISVYRNGKLMEGKTLTIDPDLTVRSTVDLSLRDVHHVRFGLLAKLRFLDAAGWDRLKKDPYFCIDILKVIKPGLINVPTVLGEKIIPRNDLNKALDELDGEDIKKIIQRNTVMCFFVETQRKNDADR